MITLEQHFVPKSLNDELHRLNVKSSFDRYRPGSRVYRVSYPLVCGGRTPSIVRLAQHLYSAHLLHEQNETNKKLHAHVTTTTRSGRPPAAFRITSHRSHIWVIRLATAPFTVALCSDAHNRLIKLMVRIVVAVVVVVCSCVSVRIRRADNTSVLLVFVALDNIHT